MAKKKVNPLGEIISLVGVPVFVHGVLVSGGLPVNRVHHWQIGAALIVLGLIVK